MDCFVTFHMTRARNCEIICVMRQSRCLITRNVHFASWVKQILSYCDKRHLSKNVIKYEVLSRKLSERLEKVQN